MGWSRNEHPPIMASKTRFVRHFHRRRAKQGFRSGEEFGEKRSVGYTVFSAVTRCARTGDGSSHICDRYVYILEIMQGLISIVQILPTVLSQALRGIASVRSIVLEPDFSLPNPCGRTYHRCPRAVLFRANARRPALHLRPPSQTPVDGFQP